MGLVVVASLSSTPLLAAKACAAFIDTSMPSSITSFFTRVGSTSRSHGRNGANAVGSSLRSPEVSSVHNRAKFSAGTSSVQSTASYAAFSALRQSLIASFVVSLINLLASTLGRELAVCLASCIASLRGISGEFAKILSKAAFISAGSFVTASAAFWTLATFDSTLPRIKAAIF